MKRAMNRETWRWFKGLSYEEGDKLLNDIYGKEIYNERVYAYKDAFSRVFTALHRRHPEMDGNELHSIAVDAVELTHGIETPEELIVQLYEETGFDIRQRVEDQGLEYIPIGGDGQ